eukprot:TRINITY_DN8077_c0_g1_i1.p1 TRINITY_DN8077_c0_g1~~TRINITY_DN8077_c0_g1_i1.p1  ORF type:complete len:1328 (+),score=401.24 TRINITY_DN8077_c0_g1_i1:121-4104(+)
MSWWQGEEYPSELRHSPIPWVACFVPDNLKKHFESIRTVSEGLFRMRVCDEVEKLHRKKPSRETYYEYKAEGILRRGWVRKHLRGCPAVVVIFVDVSDIKEDWGLHEDDVMKLSEQVRERVSKYCRIMFLAVAKGKDGETQQYEDERIVRLKKREETERKQIFSMLESSVNDFAKLQKHLSQLLDGYLKDRLKAVKKHRNDVNKTLQLDLVCRFRIKMAFFSECMRQNTRAVKHYRSAYRHFRSLMEESSGQVEKTFEVLAASEWVTWRLFVILARQHQMGEAVALFRSHIRWYREVLVSDRWAFLRALGIYRQFKNFGDHVNRQTRSVVRVHLERTTSPAFYYHAAAQALSQRRYFLAKARALYPRNSPVLQKDADSLVKDDSTHHASAENLEDESSISKPSGQREKEQKGERSHDSHDSREIELDNEGDDEEESIDGTQETSPEQGGEHDEDEEEAKEDVLIEDEDEREKGEKEDDPKLVAGKGKTKGKGNGMEKGETQQLDDSTASDESDTSIRETSMDQNIPENTLSLEQKKEKTDDYDLSFIGDVDDVLKEIEFAEQFDDSSRMIKMLTFAYDFYKQDNLQRTILGIAQQMALEYFRIGDFETAKRFFDRVVRTYRREHWQKIAISVLTRGMICNQKIGSYWDAALCAAELCSRVHASDRKKSIQHVCELASFARTARSSQIHLSPPPIALLDTKDKDDKKEQSVSSEKVPTDGFNGKEPVFDMSKMDSIVSCSTSFSTRAVHVGGESTYVDIAFTSKCPVLLCLSNICVKFSDSEYNCDAKIKGKNKSLEEDDCVLSEFGAKCNVSLEVNPRTPMTLSISCIEANVEFRALEGEMPRSNEESVGGLGFRDSDFPFSLQFRWSSSSILRRPGGTAPRVQYLKQEPYPVLEVHQAIPRLRVHVIHPSVLFSGESVPVEVVLSSPDEPTFGGIMVLESGMEVVDENGERLNHIGKTFPALHGEEKFVMTFFARPISSSAKKCTIQLVYKSPHDEKCYLEKVIMFVVTTPVRVHTQLVSSVSYMNERIFRDVHRAPTDEEWANAGHRVFSSCMIEDNVMVDEPFQCVLDIHNGSSSSLVLLHVDVEKGDDAFFCPENRVFFFGEDEEEDKERKKADDALKCDVDGDVDAAAKDEESTRLEMSDLTDVVGNDLGFGETASAAFQLTAKRDGMKMSPGVIRVVCKRKLFDVDFEVPSKTKLPRPFSIRFPMFPLNVIEHPCCVRLQYPRHLYQWESFELFIWIRNKGDNVERLQISVSDSSQFVYAGMRSHTVTVMPKKSSRIGHVLVPISSGQILLPSLSIVCERSKVTIHAFTDKRGVFVEPAKN